MVNCQEIILEIISNLQNEFECVSVLNSSAIITPFCYLDGDCIQLLIEPIIDGHFRLTDAGFTSRRLIEFYFNFSSDKNKKLINSIVEANGIRYKHGELYIKFFELNDISRQFLSLIKAIQQINVLIFTIDEKTSNKFNEKVATFLQERNFGVSRFRRIKGSSEMSWTIDIYLNSTQNTLIKTLSSKSKSGMKTQVNHAYVSFDDIKKAHPNYTAAAIVDNEAQEFFTDEEATLLRQKLDMPVSCWSEIEKFSEDLLTLSELSTT